MVRRIELALSSKTIQGEMKRISDIELELLLDKAANRPVPEPNSFGYTRLQSALVSQRRGRTTVVVAWGLSLALLLVVLVKQNNSKLEQAKGHWAQSFGISDTYQLYGE